MTLIISILARFERERKTERERERERQHSFFILALLSPLTFDVGHFPLRRFCVLYNRHAPVKSIPIRDHGAYSLKKLPT